MKTLLKNARVEKKLLVKDVAIQSNIDQALISKFEHGTRKPTKDQLAKLAQVLGMDYNGLLVVWLKEKILYELREETGGLEALKLAEEALKYEISVVKQKISKGLQSTIDSLDALKKELDQLRAFDSYRIAQAIDLEYTFESNRIEGNTLTLRETDLVVNEGITVSGKSMREHLEAINHSEAIAFIKKIIVNKLPLKESTILQIHQLILRGIMPENAGKYRKVQVMIQGSKHLPPQPFLVKKQMEDFFIWFESKKNILHPVLLAAETHERLVSIHPFIDGNGRTSRLIMNLILLQQGYVIANIKGDYSSRMRYYQSLEDAQITKNKEPFLQFITQVEKESLQRYLKILKP
ncbi:MAG: DNA-binding protein [Bacteroidetes bacterium HGW-Bacteroidetes-2]|jgi:Fic family protein|nr:MAG: DNA-binding protein [Bacteroidetes bacterium HGW-Bacteroidetes-2]